MNRRSEYVSVSSPTRGFCNRALFSTIQSVWSKQRDGCSLAHEIPAADAGRFESCISRKLLGGAWILNESSIECHEKKRQPFSLSGVRFGSRAILISG